MTSCTRSIVHPHTCMHADQVDEIKNLQIELKVSRVSEKIHCHISTSSCSLSHPLPHTSYLAFPYLNEHPRHGDEIILLWHFSAKSSMGAKIKLSERAELSGRHPALPVRQQRHSGLLDCLQNPNPSDSPRVSAVEALISTS